MTWAKHTRERVVSERRGESGLTEEGSNWTTWQIAENDHYPQIPRERKELHTPPRLQGRSRVFAVGHSRDQTLRRYKGLSHLELSNPNAHPPRDSVLTTLNAKALTSQSFTIAMVHKSWWPSGVLR